MSRRRTSLVLPLAAAVACAAFGGSAIAQPTDAGPAIRRGEGARGHRPWRCPMRAVLAVLVVLAIGAGLGAPAAFTQSRGIIPLPRLVAQTRQAHATTFLRRPGSRIASASVFRAMRRYVVARYAGIRAQHSFRDETGQVVDCLAFGDQPSLRGVRGASRVPPAPELAPDGRPAGATGTSFAPERNADAALDPEDRDRAGNVAFAAAGSCRSAV